jgi:hypothetical protein
MARGFTSAVMLGVSAIGLLALLGGCASGGRSEPSPTASSRGASSATTSSMTAPGTVRSVLTLEDNALLSLVDIAQPGWRPTSLGAKPPPWAFEKPRCPAYRADDYPAQQHRVEARGRLFQRPTASVREWVVRYETGWGTRSLDDTRRLVELCGSYEYGQPGQPGFRETNAIVDERFAGDESMLVKTDRINVPGAIESGLTVLVRHADFVITLTATGVPADDLHRLGQRAASHLG